MTEEETVVEREPEREDIRPQPKVPTGIVLPGRVEEMVVPSSEEARQQWDPNYWTDQFLSPYGYGSGDDRKAALRWASRGKLGR